MVLVSLCGSERFPLKCRIVNVCDAFDEMICGIGCKRVKVYEAIEYLKNYKIFYLMLKL